MQQKVINVEKEMQILKQMFSLHKDEILNSFSTSTSIDVLR